MTTSNLTKLTGKYSPQEITTAVKVLVDVLALQQEGDFQTIDPKENLTPSQIKRLQKQLSEHSKGKSQYLSLKQVSHALGL